MTADPLDLGMVPVEQPDGSTRWTWPEVRADDRAKRELEGEEIERILEWGNGYFQGHSRELLEGFLDGRWDVEEHELDRIETRVQRLMDKDIPPVFQQTWESVSSGYHDGHGRFFKEYPVLDEIINIFKTGKSRHPIDRSYAAPAPVHSILHFRDYALRPDIAKTVELELQLRVQHIYRAQLREKDSRSIMWNIRKGFRHLKRGLAAMPARPEYLSYNPDKRTAPEIVKRRFWYTRFKPDDIKAIVGDYWQAVEEELDAGKSHRGRTVLLNAGFSGYRVVKKLFPDQSPSPEELEARAAHAYSRRIVDAAVPKRAWGLVTKTVIAGLDDYEKKVLQGEVNAYLRERAVELRDLNKPKIHALSGIGLPYSIIDDVPVELDAVHAQVAKQATPDEVADSLSGINALFMRYRPTTRAVVEQKLAEYLQSAPDPSAVDELPGFLVRGAMSL